MRQTSFMLTLAALAIMTSCTTPDVSKTESLTAWQYSQDSASWTDVKVPHSYNGVDGRTAKYYRGKGYYKRNLTLNTDQATQPVYVLLEGAAQKATIYLNGEQIMHHKGGYTAFYIDLTGKVKAGNNELTVVCDNTLDLTLAPIDSDFNKNGGLHNPVSLMVMSPIHFSTEKYGQKRIHVCTPEVSDQEATVQLTAAVRNASQSNEKVTVKYTITDATGAIVASQETSLETTQGNTTDVCQKIQLKTPHLWNGTEDPYLYTATMQVMEGNTAVDVVKTRFGVRTYKMDRENGFSLNGKPYALRGTSIHQDIEGKATALDYEDYVKDYEIVKELGCNFVRLAHYPHNNIAFDLCDSLGLIVQTEIPWVNVCGVRAEEAYLENLQNQMNEMVRNLYNHPSIVFWGIFNEVAPWGNREHLQGPIDFDKVIRYVASLYDLAKSIDPLRYVGVTDCELLQPDPYLQLKADYISENRYFGWYYGKFDDFKPAITGVWEKDRITNVSEYGAGVNPWCHSWDVKQINNKDNAKHYEEWGNMYHESHLTQIEQMPWLNFTSLWILFDFPVASRKEGYLNSDDGVNFTDNPDRYYTNDKGLVTRDRKLKKDAFYMYKAKWNKQEETIYISSRRLKKIPASLAYQVKVYSNAKTLTLYQDGKEIETLKGSGEITGVIWKFKPVKLNGKQSTFKVVSDSGKEDQITLESL